MKEIWNLVDLYKLKKVDIKSAEEIMAKAYFEVQDKFQFRKKSNYLKFLEKFMHVTLRYALKHGKVYATSPQLEGIAVWLPNDKVFISNWQYVKSGILVPILLAGREWLKRMKIYDDICKVKHRKHAKFPHLYLYNLAVNPKYQKMGYASKLLNPVLEILNRLKLACYLETDERNIKLYEHFGFEVVEKEYIKELDSVACFMLRKGKKYP